MEATIKQMEENFQMEKKSFQDLNRHQLQEISGWLVDQSRSNQMEEELQESTRKVHEDRREVEYKTCP